MGRRCGGGWRWTGECEGFGDAATPTRGKDADLTGNEGENVGTSVGLAGQEKGNGGRLNREEKAAGRRGRWMGTHYHSGSDPHGSAAGAGQEVDLGEAGSRFRGWR